MSDEFILYDVAEGVATITLNRPQKLNAFIAPMTQGLGDALKAADRDENVRVLVVTGAGRAFSAGQDLAELQAEEDVVLSEHIRQGFNRVILQMREMEKPIVGALNGPVAGAALGVALATDIRIASENATFISAFIRIGLAPDSGVSWLLTRAVGPTKALELMLTGDSLSAQTALKYGLVNEVVPQDKLDSVVRSWVEPLASGPTKAYGLTKRIFNKAQTASLAEMLEYEAMLQDVAAETADHQEGVAAFLEKRPPQFKGK